MLIEVKTKKTLSKKASKDIRPPKEWGSKARKWWELVEQGWILDSCARFNLLVALSNYNRAEKAAEIVQKEGLIVDGKAHPALKIIKDCDLVMLRAWKNIGLDMEPPNHQIGRPAESYSK